MNNLSNILTEALNGYEKQQLTHPLFKEAAAGHLSLELLQEFAALQDIDSVLWVPMLALMKDRVNHPKLRDAFSG